MTNPLLTQIVTLQFDEFGSTFGAPACGLEFAPTSTVSNYKPKEPFRITMWNDGFEANRTLSRQDLASIIDWATMALREMKE